MLVDRRALVNRYVGWSKIFAFKLSPKKNLLLLYLVTEEGIVPIDAIAQEILHLNIPEYVVRNWHQWLY